jgi:glycine dehydrogenase subunit 2
MRGAGRGASTDVGAAPSNAAPRHTAVQVGLLGVGLLGLALARRLIARGFRVLGFDLSPDRMDALAEAGGHPASSAAAALRGSRPCLLALYDDTQTDALLEELTPHLTPGDLLVDCGTGDPERAVARAALVRQRSAHLLDAPLSGSSRQVLEGEAMMLVGGDPEAYDAAAGVLDAIAPTRFYLGSAGSGSRAKLATNLLLGLNRAALAEALAFAESLGLDGVAFLEVVRASPAYSRAVDVKGARMLSREYTPDSRLRQHRKDLDLIADAAARSGAVLPLTRAHTELLDSAIAGGLGDLDNAAIIELFRTSPPPLCGSMREASCPSRSLLRMPDASTVHPAPVPVLYDESVPGRVGFALPPLDVPTRAAAELLPGVATRTDLPLPEAGELQVIRHFIRLSHRNHAIDVGFYPLGSCTMKYNPKINEEVVRLPGIAGCHPYQPEDQVQGELALMWALERLLCEIGGMDRATLQPAAGAAGEFTGLLIIRAYHRRRGEAHRDIVIVPDSSHGTNPATAARCGFKTVSIKSNERGRVDLEALKAAVNERTAAIMLTNPNTLGLFEQEIAEIAQVVHDAGGLLYMDGANMNAILGITRPGDMGFDVMHYNLHKTMSTPHGGGGPGCGPVAVKQFLAEYLPTPTVIRDGDRYRWQHDLPHSIGKVHGFYGNFGIAARAYAYIRSQGREGLRDISETAVLNANYLASMLAGSFNFPNGARCMHEFVLSADRQKAEGASALDVAKRLMDFGFYPPTIYFPLIVREAMMIEPTETETPETLREFAAAMNRIAEEARTEPDLLKSAPHHTPVGRLDEVTAARDPVLAYNCCPPPEP